MQLPKRFKDFVYPPRGDLVRMRFHERGPIEALVPDDERFGLARELILQRVYDMVGGIPSGTVVDAGAHVGLFSLVASQYASKVVSVEPDPINFKVLSLNVELNEASNVKPINAALWTEPGTVSFGTSWHTTGGSVSGSGDAEVKAVTLEEIVQEVGEVDLLKLDIEGAELKVVPATKVLDKVKRVVAELHLDEPGDERELVETLEGAGFDVELISAESLYRPGEARKVLRNWGALERHTWIKLGVIAYFLAPVEKPRRPEGSRDMPLLVARR